MNKLRIIAALAVLAYFMSACGAKPAMEGGSSDSSEYGSVGDAYDGGVAGDTTSFSDDYSEKVDEYVVRPGDNLWDISAKSAVYGSGWLYPLILKANRDKIKNPRDLKVGTVLAIPRGLGKAQHDMAREEAMAGTFEHDAGPLQEMVTDIPQAPPMVQQAEVAAPATAPAGGTGWGWLLWLLLALALAAAAWFLVRGRQKRAAESGDKE
jgi:hypothetical protein